MSAQECTAALKIQEAWRKWQGSHPICTCTTVFYPDGEKMIPEKHSLLRCCDCGMREDFPLDGSVLYWHMLTLPPMDIMVPRCHQCQSAYAEHDELEKKEKSAVQIQEAWQKYRESHSCPVCLTIIGKDSCTTKCGHKFCTGCLLKAVQRNSSCPLCRNPLLENGEVVDDEDEENEMGLSMFNGDELDAAVYYQTDYEQGRLDGRQEAAEEYARTVDQTNFEINSVYNDGRQEVQEENARSGDQISIRLTYYDQGYEDGRQHAEEEFQPRMREEIDIATQKAYDDGVVQGRSLASEDIRLLREEVKRLKQRNSRLREDLQFATQPTREIYR